MTEAGASYSPKIVFLLQSGSQGCKILKDYLKISSDDENLVCNYLSHEIQKKGMKINLKIYFVHRVEKQEKLHSLYFKNAHFGVIVFDVGADDCSFIEKNVEDLKLNNSNICIVNIGYKDDKAVINQNDLIDLIANIQAYYFEFSDASGLKSALQSLEDNILFLNKGGCTPMS